MLTPAFSGLGQTPDSLKAGVYAFATPPTINKAGAAQRVLLDGSTRDFTHLKLHITTVPAHQAPHPAHQHPEEELVIVKEGELTVTVGGKATTLGPGSIALLIPGDIHGFENQGNSPATYYVMRYEARAPRDSAQSLIAGGSFCINWKDLAYQTHDKGGIRRFFDRPTAMTKRFEMHATTLNEGLWSHPPHQHRAAEILLMLDQSAEESISGTLRPATVGDVIFLESNVPHAIHNTSRGPCTYLAFQFE